MIQRRPPSVNMRSITSSRTRGKVPARGAPACRFMTIDAFCGPRPLPGEPDVLYRNTGKGGFADVTKSAGVAEPGHYGFGVLFSDLDDLARAWQRDKQFVPGGDPQAIANLRAAWRAAIACA